MKAGISRRGLLGAGAGLATTMAIGSRAARPEQAVARTAEAATPCPLLPPERIGLQLYSVRSAVSELGFARVLETVAEIGFEHVEFAGYTQGSSPEITLQELRSLLDANGLTASASHVSPSDDASMQKILDEAEALGIPQVGLSLLTPSGLPDTGGWRAAAEQYNRYAELASRRGMTFYMHNHFQEWLPTLDDPSKRGIDVLLEETDPRHVSWEMDIFWSYVGASQAGGAFDPLQDYAIRHRDRIQLFHVKDGVPGTLQILDVGEGAIDFQTFFTTLFAQAPDQASRHLYLWERDNAEDHPRGALAAARSSFVNMRHGLKGAGECSPAGFEATISGVRFRRGSLRAALQLDEPAQVTATLRRGRRRLATATRDVAAGRRTFDLAVPKRVDPGPATLVLVVAGESGTVTLRRPVRIPPGSAAARSA